MSQSQPEEEAKEAINFTRPVFLVLLLICLWLAGIVFLETFSDFDFVFLLDNPLIFPALLLQTTASLLFILAWKLLLGAQAHRQFSFAECTAHIGITLLGKYLPGKVWGLIGRTYLLGNRGVTKSEAISLLLADQFITFYTGIMIGTVALCAYFNLGLAIPLAALSLCAIPIIGSSYNRIITWLMQYLGRWVKKVSPPQGLQEIEITGPRFIRCSAAYLLHWLATAAVLVMLFHPLISVDLAPASSLIVAAIPLAMLAGFLALWAPGGIGVREAVIIGILLIGLPLDVAIALALSYRLICIIIDICFGLFTLFYHSDALSGVLRNKS